MIYLIGMGPGGRDYLTPLAEKTVAGAERVYGFAKHKELLGIEDERWESVAGRLDDLPGRLAALDPDGSGNLAVLVSGDPQVFSLSRRFFAVLPKERLRIIPGIGSSQILGSALGLQSPLPRRVSLHGHSIRNLLPALYRREGVFLYTDGENNPRALASYMDEKGFSLWRIIVGFSLGTEEQRIEEYTVRTMLREPEERDWGLNLVYAEPLPETEERPGRLYGIGIGPGDPELITLKALRLIRESDVILCPRAGMKKSSLAREILEQAAGTELPFREISYPVVRDQDAISGHWQEIAAECAVLLREGKTVSLITLGDPSLYSTFSYLCAALEDLMPGAPWEIVPGVSSIQLAAAELGMPLALKKESCAIVPCPEDMAELLPLLESHESLVLMKLGKRIGDLRSFLREHDMEDRAAFISRAGMEDEYKVLSFRDLDEGAESGLSVVMIRRTRRI
jgi:precorrin-2/cobalt-factor-2 C20-methyltransferase